MYYTHNPNRLISLSTMGTFKLHQQALILAGFNEKCVTTKNIFLKECLFFVISCEASTYSLQKHFIYNSDETSNDQLNDRKYFNQSQNIFNITFQINVKKNSNRDNILIKTYFSLDKIY